MKTEMISCVNLFQPWADAIVEGKLPILIRTFPINKRGKIGIAAMEKFDAVVFIMLSDRELRAAEESLSFGSVIGLVEIRECIPVHFKEASNVLTELIGETNANFYPAHLIPRRDRVFFWILANPSRLDKPVRIKSKGITWSTAEIQRSRSRSRSKRKSFWDCFPIEKLLEFNSLYRAEVLI